MALLVYVDGIVVVGNNSSACVSMKQLLDRRFRIKDFRKLKYFLAIEMTHGSNCIL